MNEVEWKCFGEHTHVRGTSAIDEWDPLWHWGWWKPFIRGFSYDAVCWMEWLGAGDRDQLEARWWDGKNLASNSGRCDRDRDLFFPSTHSWTWKNGNWGTVRWNYDLWERIFRIDVRGGGKSPDKKRVVSFECMWKTQPDYYNQKILVYSHHFSSCYPNRLYL